MSSLDPSDDRRKKESPQKHENANLPADPFLVNLEQFQIDEFEAIGRLREAGPRSEKIFNILSSWLGSRNEAASRMAISLLIGAINRAIPEKRPWLERKLAALANDSEHPRRKTLALQLLFLSGKSPGERPRLDVFQDMLAQPDKTILGLAVQRLCSDIFDSIREKDYQEAALTLERFGGCFFTLLGDMSFSKDLFSAKATLFLLCSDLAGNKDFLPTFAATVIKEANECFSRKTENKQAILHAILQIRIQLSLDVEQLREFDAVTNDLLEMTDMAPPLRRMFTIRCTGSSS